MDLRGVWKNEYGSIMKIKKCEDGIMSGTYSSDTGATGKYKLTGAYDTSPIEGLAQTVSFSVSWRSVDDPEQIRYSHWCSSFAGFHQMQKAQQIIKCTYLMVKCGKKDEEWKDTVVDKCTFLKM